MLHSLPRISRDTLGVTSFLLWSPYEAALHLCVLVEVTLHESDLPKVGILRHMTACGNVGRKWDHLFLFTTVAALLFRSLRHGAAF